MTITDNLPARRVLVAVVREPAERDDRLPVLVTAPQPADAPVVGVSLASVVGIGVGMAAITGAALAFTQYVA